MYTTVNYKTKKALKQAVKDGAKICIFQPGPFGSASLVNGKVSLEGPHYPKPHTWYASATVVDGVVTKVS